MISTEKYYHLLFFFFFCITVVSARQINNFRHYSVNDGLRQSTIKEIVQDKNGCIWLATFDGLVKYDGYEFENHKVLSSGISKIAQTNRVDNIREDAFGRFWINSLDDIYCYNPANNTYWSFASIKEFENSQLKPDRLEIKPSGKIWLMLNNNGAISIDDSLFNYTSYFTGTDYPDIKVNKVFEDEAYNSWLLTDMGLGFVARDDQNKIVYPLHGEPQENEKHVQFYCAFESNRHIWFGSESGEIWCYTKSSRTFRKQTTPAKSGIRHITQPQKDILVLLTANDGFIIYDVKDESAHHVNTKAYPILKDNHIYYKFMERPDFFWFSTEANGIFKINVHSKEVKAYHSELNPPKKLISHPIPFIVQDADKNLIIQPSGEMLSTYNPEKDMLEPLFSNEDIQLNKLYNYANIAFIDKQDNIWISSFAHGLIKASLNQGQFDILQPSAEGGDLTTNHVRAIYEGSDGKVWMATKGNKIMIYNRKLDHFAHVAPDGKLQKSDWPTPIYAITEDEDHNIWLGSRGSGLYRLTPTENKPVYKVTNFRHNENDPYSLSNNDIYSIKQDQNKNIWIATFGGGINLILPSESAPLKFIHSNNQLSGFPIDLAYRVRSIESGSDNMMFAGTSSGLLAWNNDFNTPEAIEFKLYNEYVEENENRIISDIMDIYVKPDEQMYLATFGGGLVLVDTFDIKGYPAQFSSYGIKSGLPSEAILSLEMDHTNKLWLSTENELIRFNPAKNTFENFTEINKVLYGNIFSEASSAYLSNGKMVFATLNGLVSFSPHEIKTNTFQPNLFLSEFKISYSGTSTYAQPDSLIAAINNTSEVTLQHNENFFNIQFSALDYNNTHNIMYRYKLEGFDNHWNYTRKQRNARYTNIPSGAYTFKVSSTNGDGIWANNERSLAITIKPSFWHTPLAYLLYALLLVAVFVGILHYTLVLYKLKSDIKLQKRMSDIKLKFFTDISHEIRTPLTMITAPVEYMLNDSRTPEESKKQLSFISQNTNRLLKLINQILDYRRIQDKHLTVSEVMLGSFTKKICLDFEEMAEDKNIDFVFNQLDEETAIWANPDDLEKVLMNLLSNAFKYNNAGNRVEVVVEMQEHTTILKVQDNGPGISKEKQKDIYTRFATFNDEGSNPSTGIGLAIVKEVIDKLGATLILESEPKKGSLFKIEFKNGYGHFDKNVEVLESFKKPEDVVSLNADQSPDEETSEKTAIASNERYQILLVEDDEKLRQFMKSVLEPEYEVHEAEDGKEGYNKAVSLAPDFIVSDVMMPKKNGIDMLKSLRNNISTSHIPIILLTAKTTIESKLESLNYGADDYITKPFSVSYFKARIQNLIKQRKLLQAIYSAEVEPADTTQTRPNFLSKHDEAFMEKVVEMIYLNLERGDFTIEELGTLIGMSRTTLFNKLKSITGMSPIEFMRDIRLKKAAQLIIEKDMLIKEVSNLIGFSDLKYFGSCFKTKYGMTPMQYRTKMREDLKNQRIQSININ